MKILVPLKRVIDYNVVVQIQSDHREVVTDNVKMSINPFDEIALEEAIRLCESGHAEEIICVSIGCSQAQEQLRQGLAMGGHRAILVHSDSSIENDPLSVAKILAELVDRNAIDLVLMGKQSIDNDCNQTGQMLAGLLNWPQATFASKVDFSKKAVEVSREVDGGAEIVSLSLPAVIKSEYLLNEPRFIALPNIMLAKQKPLDELTLDDLKLNLKPKIVRKKLDFPEKRQAGEVFTDIDTFLERLDKDAIWD